MILKKLPGLIVFSAALICFGYAPLKKNPSAGSLLKSIAVAGITTTRFVYDPEGKLYEKESLWGYERFSYDNNGRLIRLDVADDPTGLSSTYIPNKNRKMLTRQNAVITHYDLFEYDSQNRLIKIKRHYKDQDGNTFKFGTLVILDYDNTDHVIKYCLCDADGTVSDFFTYTYDPAGNVSNEKYYSFMDAPYHYMHKLISETFYKYDDKHNPYCSIAYEPGSPGKSTNPNNITETTSVSYHNGGSKIITKSSIVYNVNGLPVTVAVNDGRGNIPENTLEYHY